MARSDVLLIGTGLAVVGGLTALVAVRFPRGDPAAVTDAYYVLASRGGRDALKHLDEWLPAGKPLLVSATPALRKLPIYQETQQLLGEHVVFVDPVPATTRGEAINLHRLAATHRWQSVTVLSHRSHTTRARALMKRHFKGDVHMRPRDVERGLRVWARAVAYETAAMMKAIFVS